jgi:8-oxo-dGTP diphosphatase
VSSDRIVRVAAGVLMRGDKVLLAQRIAGTPYGGYWEFPGGKLEAGESPHAALTRELAEELGIAVTRAAPWLTRRYVYPHAEVELNFFRVFEWTGEPHGRDGQALAWQTPGDFQVAPLLPANTIVLRALELPPFYAISMAAELGDDEFLVRARRAVDGGVRLIQLREKSFAPERLRRIAAPLLSYARERGARVLLNGDAHTARALGCAGVHWTTARLQAANQRPTDLLCAASVHDAAELAHAVRLELDFAVLGPVVETPSHPDAAPIGWQRFGELVGASPLPVYALGGLGPDDLATAIDHGAHGVAFQRAAWG